MEKPSLVYYSILQYREENRKFLESHFRVTELPNPSQDTPRVLAEAHTILAPLGYYFDALKMDQAPRLKVIGSNTTGHPHIDVEEAKRRGIKVVTLKDQSEFLRSITPTAEFTWGLIIALTRHLIPAHQAALSGQWNRRPYGGQAMLSRSRLGIVGLGRLGTMVFNYGRAFGMKMAYYDPFVLSMDPMIERKQTLKDLVQGSDIVTVHVPHQKETEHLFDAEIFRNFNRGSFFINTSRGELVDHTALLEALRAGRLAGAALDVFEGEFSNNFETKLKAHPLYEYAMTHRNVILTPHIGGSTEDAWALTERHTLKKILEAFQKHDPVQRQEAGS